MSVVGFYTDEAGRRRPITAKQVRDYVSRVRYLRYSERNRLIEKLLRNEFPKVSVKTTSPGWLRILVVADRPHTDPCDGKCEKCRSHKWEVEKRVWQLLDESGLDEHIGVYYDDFGDKHKQCIIDVALRLPDFPREEIVKRPPIKRISPAKCEHRNVLWGADGKTGICINCGMTIRR